MKAHGEGYSQVLWLDGVERRYIEEVGAMNIFFKINGTVVTPQLNGSIPRSLLYLYGPAKGILNLAKLNSCHCIVKLLA